MVHSIDGCCNISVLKHIRLCVAIYIWNGLADLHQNDVAHRDLKLDNVLVANQQYSKDTYLGGKNPTIAKKKSETILSSGNFDFVAKLE